MRKWVFRLAKVLELRNQAEEVKRLELAQMRADLARTEDAAREMERALWMVEDYLLQAETSGTSVFDLKNLGIQRLLKRLDLAEQHLVVEAAKKQVQEKQQEVLAAVRERKVLENLRSRRFSQYRIHRERYRQKKLDELAVTRGYGV